MLKVKITCIAMIDGNVRLLWQNDDKEHEGFIPVQWLKQNCYSKEELVKKRRGAEPMVAPKVTIKVISPPNKYYSRGTFLKLIVMQLWNLIMEYGSTACTQPLHNNYDIYCE